MSFFIQIMGIFWTLAEIAIIYFLITGISVVQNIPKPKLIAVLFMALSMFLIWMMLWSESFFASFIDFHHESYLIFFRRAVWNFFCTIWVILEGCIMIYVLKIYQMLRTAIDYPQKYFQFDFICRWGIPSIFLFFFLMFGFYEYSLWKFMSKYGASITDVHRISVFYIKICGVWWIIFDAGVALIGFFTYQLLRFRVA